VKTVTEGDKTFQVIAWDMTKSGLYTNFAGDKPSVCVGQTIFGLTSTDSAGKSDIHLITFAKDVDALVTGIENLETAKPSTAISYSIDGKKVDDVYKGVVIHSGKKIIRTTKHNKS
jgi:hypothetical protein